jgi:hypothetical protein
MARLIAGQCTATPALAQPPSARDLATDPLPEQPVTKLALAVCAGLIVAGSGGRQDDELTRLQWLAGCWELSRGARTTLEMWMPPASGMMLGASRTVVNGAVREWEQVRLSVRDGRVVYTANPSGQAQAEFTATTVSDSGFTVENPEHDFPQRIIYRRQGADSLIARIEGATSRGPRGADFPMRRVRCEAPG